MQKIRPILTTVLAAATALASAQERPLLTWKKLENIPPATGEKDQHGLAGPFVGASRGALILAGGANFPDKAPWDGGAKKWWDSIYVYTNEKWTALDAPRLPRAIAYGVSVSTEKGVLCIGGSDSEKCYADAFWMKWDPATQKLDIEKATPLPKPLAMMAGALVNNTVYVAGGQESTTGAGTTHAYSLDLSAASGAAWQALPDLPGPPRVVPVAAGLSGGAAPGFYLFSGRNIAPDMPTQPLTDAWRFDIGKKTWEQLPDVSLGGIQPMCVMAGTATNWKDQGVLVMGGDSGEIFMALEHLRVDGSKVGAKERTVLKDAAAKIQINHDGFARNMLYFDAAAKSWSVVGKLPFPSPVTTIATWLNDSLILASGEVHPAVRTAEAWSGAPVTGAASIPTNHSAQPYFETTDLFQAGQFGVETFRIPSLAITPKGTLLAFTSARKGGHGDWAEIDLMMRRSPDAGVTWEPAITVADNGTGVADNPCVIVDQDSGAIHFLNQTDYHKCFYRRSDDDGKTFSTPVEITDVFKPLLDPRKWEVLAPTPGHGVRLHTGRLVVPVWVAQGPKAHRPSVVATIYSNDNGKTWLLGDVVVDNTETTPNPSESVAIELSDGRVMLNIRNESKRYRRLVAYSPDGATKWTKPEFVEELYDPICMASMTRLSTAANQDRDRILFSNPNSIGSTGGTLLSWGAKVRANVTVRMSYDEGKAWPVSRVIEPGLSGYTDLAADPDRLIYCLYERKNTLPDASAFAPKFLSLARFNTAWLTEGEDVIPAKGAAK